MHEYAKHFMRWKNAHNQTGSHAHTLLTVLSFVGESPVTALGLLGSVRSYMDLIHRLTMLQKFRFQDSEERFACRMLTVSGKGKYKTIRLHKSALSPA